MYNNESQCQNLFHLYCGIAAYKSQATAKNVQHTTQHLLNTNPHTPATVSRPDTEITEQVQLLRQLDAHEMTHPRKTSCPPGLQAELESVQ